MDNNKLEFLRDRNNLFKADVARALNVSDSIYCRWESNKTTIPVRRLIQLADFYQVNIDYLVGFTNKRLEIKHKKLDKKLIGNRVKNLRCELKMTQEELADLLGTTHSTISAYESGKTLILSSFVFVICKKTNTSIDYLLGRTNNKRLE